MTKKKSLFHILFQDGTSTFDAWLNATSIQISQSLLTLPLSFAQLGMGSGVFYQLIYAFMGCWSSYMTASLYLIYRQQHKKSHTDHSLYTMQWYEVLDELLGWKWKYLALIFNISYQFVGCVICIVGCSSLTHFLDDRLNKRMWTIVLLGCFISAVFIPRAQHYRVWSCMGVVAISYTAWYLTLASIVNGKDVKLTAPWSTSKYFVGAANFLFIFGGHSLTVEIMEAMHKPHEFSKTYCFSVLYVLTLTLPSAISVYWAFGESMLNNSYAFGVLKQSKFRQAAIFLMLIHQFMQFGFYALPLFMMWEKFIGTHTSTNYYLKSASRIPVVLLMWFLAILVPFIGLLDSIIGATCTSVSVYIIPCAAHMMFHRSSTIRDKLPCWPGWIKVYCLNLAVILWVSVVGVGLGSWSGIVTLLEKIHTFGIFPKCYQCKT